MNVTGGHSFYVTLLSNASINLYSRNTLNSFTVHLAKPVDLGSPHKWEVGVCEVICHHPQAGNYQNSMVIGETNALIYCDLISE